MRRQKLQVGLGFLLLCISVSAAPAIVAAVVAFAAAAVVAAWAFDSPTDRFTISEPEIRRLTAYGI